MKKQLLLFLLMLLPMVASADAVEINGIWYNLIPKAKQAEVTSTPSGEYTGTVVIPESVTYQNVDYSVTSIGNGAFRDCSGLTSVTIPNSVTGIGSNAFLGCSGLTSVNISDLEAWCKISFNGSYSNPLCYAHHLFLNGEEVKDLVIPNSVTSIGECAFYGCSGLTSVTIPNSVTSIGNIAFYGCSGLTSVTIGNSVTTIGDYAFEYCSGLTSVTIPNSVTSIGIGAFLGCSGLTSVTIPNSMTSIGVGAFYGCSGLTSVTIPNSVTSIGVAAFRDCSGLTSVTIPNSVTSIGDWAFGGCSGLTSVTIPNSVTSIEYHTFAYCSRLTSVTISNSVTSIGDGAFYGCSGLTSVTIPNSVTSIGVAAFRDCSGLTSVTIPNSVTSIGELAFYQCSGLTSVTIPNSVTSIEYHTFAYCSRLTSVTIGSGIKSIGSYAFGTCPELTDVYCHAIDVPSTSTDAFNDSYIGYATLHVPAESVNAYRAADPWKNFKSIVSIEGGDIPEPQKCAIPSIFYGNKKLLFNCETEGVEYVYEIKDADIKKGYDSEVQLSATYEISVYATKQGYENSDIATATLVWGSAVFTETTGQATAAPAINVESPLLIQSQGGLLTIQGADDGTKIGVYNINGTLAGEGTSRNGCATVNTNLQPGSVAIIKIGNRSVKVVVK